MKLEVRSDEVRIPSRAFIRRQLTVNVLKYNGLTVY